MDDLTELAGAVHPTYRATPRRPSNEAPGYVLLAVCGWIAIAAGIFVIFVGISLVLNGTVQAGRVVDAGGVEYVSRSIRTSGENLGMAFVAAGILSILHGAVALAVRDIARNSWRR